MSASTSLPAEPTLSPLQVDAPKHQTRLKVVLLSLPARTQAVLEFFFNSTGRTSFTPVSQDQADAAIFDLDTLESRQHWLNFHGQTGRPGIALSVQPLEVEGAVWVRKPVTPAALLAAVADIHAERWVKPAAAPVVQPEAKQPAAQGEPPVSVNPAETAREALDQALAQLPSLTDPVATPDPLPGPADVQAVATSTAKVELVPSRPVPPADPAASPVSGPVAVPPLPVHDSQPVSAASASGIKPGRPAKPAEPERSAPSGGFGGLLRRFFGGAPASAPAANGPRGEATLASAGAIGTPIAPVDRPVPQPTAQHAVPALPEVVPAPVPAATATAPLALRAAPLVPPAPAPDSPRPALALPSAPHPTPGADRGEVRPLVARAQPAREVTAVAPVVESAAIPKAALPTQSASSEPVVTESAQAEPATARQRLLGAAAAAAAANEPQLCGLREDVPAHQLNEDPELRYDPDVHLVSALREAYLVGAKWQVPTQLECSAGRIIVDNTRNLLLCDFDVQRLDALLATPLGKRPKTRTLNRQEQSEVQERVLHEQGTRRLDDLLWRAGLLTASGRLPIESDPNRPVYLRHWPNLTRISAIPHAVRIAALWSARGASLVETATLLNIPQRHVIAFYNGALALDLITEDGSQIRRAQRKAGRNRGLLTRLLGWLHR